MDQALPKEFKDRMRSLLGDEEYEAFEAAFESSDPVRALRVNTLKMSVETFRKVCDFETSDIGHIEGGFRFNTEHIGTHPLHLSGAIYVQEPGAMTPVECVRIEPRMWVLDVCAAPGGKSSQAAAKLDGTGVIVTNEIDAKRVKVLCQNLERLGVENAVVLNTDSATLGETYARTFDLVIADVPCSGEGMMRKNPLAISEWSLENIERCAERQRDILENVVDCVADGGTLLYSTCTFAPEENEHIIHDFLKAHPDFRLVDLPARIKNVTSDGFPVGGDEELKKCRRFYPHISGGEGQFAAVLLRDGERSAQTDDEMTASGGKKGRADKNQGKKNNDKDEELIRVFLSEVLTAEGLERTSGMKLLEDRECYYLCPNIPLPKRAECVKMLGVPVGSVVKGRVVPHHGFFSAYGKYFVVKIDLGVGDAELAQYLHGEEIATDAEDGFAAVLFRGAPIGGAKVSRGRAKNYYPKGLRV